MIYLAVISSASRTSPTSQHTAVKSISVPGSLSVDLLGSGCVRPGGLPSQINVLITF